MQTVIHKEKSLAIAYDAGVMDTPGAEYFSVEFWKTRQALNGEALGRGLHPPTRRIQGPSSVR